MTDQLPKTIRVSGQVFKIVFDDNLANDEDKFGNVNFRTLTITINGTCPIPVKTDALWHEIMEIINAQNELKLSHNKIQCISNALNQIASDNKDLI
jgi:hypothetical protein